MADKKYNLNYSKLIISLTRNLPKDVTDKFYYPYLELGGLIDAASTFYLSGFNTSLEKVSYDKKMFRFGSVSLVLSVVSDGATGSLQEELRKVFFKKTVFIDLLGVANDIPVASCKCFDIVYIARNFYLQGYDVRTSCAGEYTVTLKCYSLDRKLSLSKYCQVYTGKCMATEIASTVIEEHLSSIREFLVEIIDKDDKTLGATESTTDGTTTSKEDKIYFSDNPFFEIDVKRLVMLGYFENVSTVVSNKNFIQKILGDDGDEAVVLSAIRSLDKNNKELKHPYLVQYNESFYDFITRVAHRCGEFFFFEHGKIIIGLPQDTRKVIFNITRDGDECTLPKEEKDKLKHFSPLCSFSGMMSGENAEDGNSGISSYNGDYINTPESSPIDETKKYFHSTYTSDESLHVVTEGDNRYHPVGRWIFDKALGDIFTSDSFVMGIGFGAGYAAWNGAWCGLLLPEFCVNPDYRTKHIKSGDNKREVNDLGEGASVDAIGAEDIANLCNNYFRDVDRWEQKAAETLVKIDFESSLKQIYLGDTICLDNLDGSPVCVVVSMHGEYSCGSAQNTAEVVPITLLSEKRGGLNAVLNPVAGEVAHIRRESSLEAIVTDVEDPLRLGRVRVRYPWQHEDTGDKSPWLRVRVPFAGGTSEYGVDSYKPGFCMTPGIGEHVMLDFVDGNLEYPFVSGSFYYLSPDGKTDHVPPVLLGYDDTSSKFYKTGHQIRTIASGKGHALVFQDKENTDLLSQTIPMVGAITQMAQIPGFLETGHYQANEKFGTIQGGSVTLRDGSGLTTITLTPNKRQIDIDSRLGKINLNAFTGITINAPNGDVVIKGKNVSIEAGNNLSIASGTNIQSDESGNLVSDTLAGLMGMLGGVGINAGIASLAGVTVENMFDLSFLRSIVETALRPVEGTLSLRSRRNVVMTAGTGNVTLTSSMMSEASTWTGKKFTAYDNLEESSANDKTVEDGDYVAVKDFLKECVAEVDNYYTPYISSLENMCDSVYNLFCILYGIPDDLRRLIKINRDDFDSHEKAFEHAKKNHAYKLLPDFIEEEAFGRQTNDVKEKIAEYYGKYKTYYQAAAAAVKELPSVCYEDFIENIIFKKNKKPFKILNSTKEPTKKNIMDALLENIYPSFLKTSLFSGKAEDLFVNGYMLPTYEHYIESQVNEMKRKVKKYIIVKTLLNFDKVKIKRTDGLDRVPIWHKAVSSGGFETYFTEDLRKVVEGETPWERFVPMVVKNDDKIINDHSATRFGKNLGRALLNTLGGSPKDAFKKLTNYNGASGPRAFSDPGGNGNILISSDAGHFSVYNDTSSQWNPKNNPDPWTIKKYIATIDSKK